MKILNKCLLLFGVLTTSALADNALVIPPLLRGDTFNLEMTESTTAFKEGIETLSLGYNGSYLGPTLEFHSGQMVNINVKNSLPESATTHWHGMHVAPKNDGGPHSVIESGDTWRLRFPVLDSASTMWYHPHLHAHTMVQVNMGLAGMIIVRDEIERRAGLPQAYGLDEFPLVIQDRSFTEDGSEISVTAFGDTMLINGTIDPFLKVPSQFVRFHVLNGSNDRSYNLGFSNNMTYYVIGADGGLLDTPAPLTRLVINPGERYDILVDFSEFENSSVTLLSYASEMDLNISGATTTPGGGTILDGVNFSLVRFDVGRRLPRALTSLPERINHQLRPIEESQATVTRTIDMSFDFNSGSFILDGQPFDMSRIDQTVFLNTTEIWEIVNSGPFASHPFHIHDIQFYILDRNGVPPEPYEAGKKDTVLVKPGETVRVITTFDDFADPDIPYMYHCHILPHEDAGMMAQFVVIDPLL